MNAKVAPAPRAGRQWNRFDMVRPFFAAIFVSISRNLTEMRNAYASSPYGERIRQKRDIVISSLHELERDCVELELRTPTYTLQSMRAILDKNNIDLDELGRLAMELHGRLVDEMRSMVYLALTARECQYYNKWAEGWEEIISRYPGTLSDVEEASKCFALGRYTATVFHSLQIIEVGLIDLGALLVVNDPQPGWAATTNKLKKILASKYTDRTRFQQENSHFIEQVYATTEALKNAWRNKVSHAQGKLTLLTKDFTPDVAEEILISSRGFMRRLATEAPSSPDPDAPAAVALPPA